MDAERKLSAIDRLMKFSMENKLVVMVRISRSSLRNGPVARRKTSKTRSVTH